MNLSFIIPVLNEELNVEELYRRIKRVITDHRLGDHEIIFIDDGSTDSTFERLLGLNKTDRKVKVIRFQSNFGKAAALNAGFEAAFGDIVFTMDGDLQDNPIEIPRFINKINKGYDLVSGWKFRRHDPITKTAPSKFFNWLTNLTTGVGIHDSNCGFKAYRKKVVKNIRIYGELHRNIPALAKWKGYKVGEIKVRHLPRKHGKSKYGFERLVKGFIDLITVKFLISFLRRPMHFFGTLGLLFLFLGFIMGIYLTFIKFIYNASIGQRPALFLAVLFIVFGTQLMSTGLLGEIFNSMNKSKEYIVKEKIGFR
jgi:glycosyltransferase involved in cell wall biosynthesis